MLKTAKVGGDGGFDYVYADAAGRRLIHCAHGCDGARITVFDLDTLEHVGDIPRISAHGEAVDPKVNHGFATSKPVAMFDSKTLSLIKTIDVEGNPDGIFFDPFNEHVYDFSHSAPNATVIDAKDGSIVGTIDLGGAPEQGVTDGKGHVYIDVEDKDNIAAVDAKTLTVTATTVCGQVWRTGRTGIRREESHSLFSVPRSGSNDDSEFRRWQNHYLTADREWDGWRGFQSQDDGSIQFATRWHVDGDQGKQPDDFEVEQNVQTMPNAKTLTMDSKTGHIVLIAAEFGPTPAPPPGGGRGGRGHMIPETFSILEVGK